MSEEKADNVFKMGEMEIVMPKRGIRFMGNWKDSHLQPILDDVFGLEELDLSVELVGDDGQLANIGSILGQVRPLVERVMDVPGIVSKAVLGWLKPDQEIEDYLLDEVPLEDYMAPLQWVVSQIFPLGKLMQTVGRPANIGKSSSLPSQNGDGKKSKPKRKRSK